MFPAFPCHGHKRFRRICQCHDIVSRQRLLDFEVEASCSHDTKTKSEDSNQYEIGRRPFDRCKRSVTTKTLNNSCRCLSSLPLLDIHEANVLDYSSVPIRSERQSLASKLIRADDAKNFVLPLTDMPSTREQSIGPFNDSRLRDIAKQLSLLICLAQNLGRFKASSGVGRSRKRQATLTSSNILNAQIVNSLYRYYTSSFCCGNPHFGWITSL